MDSFQIQSQTPSSIDFFIKKKTIEIDSLEFATARAFTEIVQKIKIVIESQSINKC